MCKETFVLSHFLLSGISLHHSTVNALFVVVVVVRNFIQSHFMHRLLLVQTHFLVLGLPRPACRQHSTVNAQAWDEIHQFYLTLDKDYPANFLLALLLEILSLPCPLT
jgi:hypothetical protein